MQTTPKKEEIVRIGRDGPLQFADGSEQAAIQRLQQEFSFGGLPPSPIAYPSPPSFNLPPAPTLASINAWAQQATWPQASPYPQAPNPALAPQAIAPRYTASPSITTFGPNTHRLPPCDLVDEGSGYIAQIELPGVKHDNVDVSCFERGILVTATATPDIDVGALVQSERGTMISFRRAINLPAPISPSGVKATLGDGILTVTLPKSNPTEGPRRVPVTNA